MRERILIAILLCALAGALAFESWRVGVTVDEPSHLLSSYLYWHGRDNLAPHDMPPMIKLLGGWVPSLMDVPVPLTLGRPGDTRHEWESSQKMMESMPGERIQPVFFFTRLTLMIFPLLTALLLWRWGRRLFGPAVGLLAALFFALEPSALGHGALFKNDLAATFGYALFWFAAWKYWIEPRPAAAAAMGGAILMAMASKLSMLFLPPLAVAVVLGRARRLGARRTAASLALLLLIPYLGLIAMYQFDTRRIPLAELRGAAKNATLPAWFVRASYIWHLLPVPWHLWQGCAALFQNNAEPNAVYLLGRLYPHGTPFYFLVALAVKVPAVIQLFLLGGLAAAILRRTPSDVFWALPGLLYIAMASMSSLQLGVRLVLPALPFGILLCAAAMHWFWERRRKAVPLAAAGLLALEAAPIYPHGIAFMNIWSGGPARGLHYLADSNLDWGQALPDLASYVHAQHIPRIRLSYFGNDNPYRYFRDSELEMVPPPWSDSDPRPTRFQPRPGYYAISATLLPGHFFAARFRDYYAVFKQMSPIARAGDSIYIYRIGL